MLNHKISQVISAVSETYEEEINLKNENRFVCCFGALLIVIGAFCSFLSLYFIFHEPISKIWLDSTIMSVFALILLSVLVIFKNEVVITYMLSAIFALYLVFVMVRYYSYIGPAIWTLALITVMFSILYEKKRMLYIILSTIIIMVIHFIFSPKKFERWDIYFLAQAVIFILLFMVIIVVHNVIRNRADKIQEQFKDIYKSQEKLYLTLQSVGDGVIAVDYAGRIEFINPIAQKITGWNAKDAIGQHFEKIFNIINEYSREKIKCPIDIVFETKEIIELANHTILISKDGTEKPIEDTIAPIVYKDGNLLGAIIVFRDFSFKKEKQKQIEYLSFHDQLTGLYNRRYFDEEFKRIDTQRNLPLSIVYADINGLKIANDAFGHGIGDQLIKKAAAAFNKVCRADDIIARIGGDEFIMLLPKTDSNHLKELVARIEKELSKKRIKGLEISLSFGWDTKNTKEQSSEDVLKNAEEYMYQRKIYNSHSKRNDVIKSILDMLIIESPQEDNHSKRVSILSRDIGKACNLSDNEIHQLQITGELHDIGKIAIDEEILNKPGKLNKTEITQIRQHAEIGYRLIATTKDFYNIAEYVLAHHERWDGKGYPKKLKGEEIPMLSRIVAVADSYDAMTSERTYHERLNKDQAIAEIKKNAGTQFDPQIARIFVEEVLEAQW